MCACYRSTVSCVICMDSEPQDWGVLDCGHIFHLDCAAKCLQTKPACPTCRKSIRGRNVKKVFIDTEQDFGDSMDQSETSRKHKEGTEQIRLLNAKLMKSEADIQEINELVEKRTESMKRAKLTLIEKTRELQQLMLLSQGEREAAAARLKDERRQLGAAINALKSEKGELEADQQLATCKIRRLEREAARHKIACTPTLAACDISRMLGESTDGLADVVAQRNQENMMLKQQIAQLESDKQSAAAAHAAALAAAAAHLEKERRAAAVKLEERSKESENRGLEVNQLEYELSKLRRQPKQQHQLAAASSSIEPEHRPMYQPRAQSISDLPPRQLPGTFSASGGLGQQQQRHPMVLASSSATAATLAGAEVAGASLHQAHPPFSFDWDDVHGTSVGAGDNEKAADDTLETKQEEELLLLGNDDDEPIPSLPQQLLGKLPTKRAHSAPPKGAHSVQKENLGPPTSVGPHSAHPTGANHGIPVASKAAATTVPAFNPGAASFANVAGGPKSQNSTGAGFKSGAAASGFNSGVPSFIGRATVESGSLIRIGPDGRGGQTRSLVPSKALQAKRAFSAEFHTNDSTHRAAQQQQQPQMPAAKKRTGAIGDQCRINQFFSKK